MTFVRDVFDTIADHVSGRANEIALFLEPGVSFEQWCIWEAFVACRAKSWLVKPEVSYSEVGLMGSPESADLLVSDPARGDRVLIELALIHDWTTNRWIASLDHDTDNLEKSLTGGHTPLQIIFAASLMSAITVNQTWNTWLAMTSIWCRSTDLERAIPLGATGQGLLKGWVIGSE